MLCWIAVQIATEHPPFELCDCESEVKDFITEHIQRLQLS